MLSITSSLPYFAIMGILLLLASAIFRWIPFYRSVVASVGASRFETLDGLRGYLALAVFFHHAVIQYHYYRTGSWGLTGSRLYEAFGPIAVMFFFMITGFLFWSKAIAKGGRVAPIPLYKNRFL